MPLPERVALLATSGDSQSTLDPHSKAAESIADLWWFMLVVATIVVAVVVALALLAVLRRRGDGTRPSQLAHRLGGEATIAIGGVALPLVVLAVLFALVLGTLDETAPEATAGDEVEIEVNARQWFWDVRYPEAGADAVTANEIHVPVGVPVRIEITSEDVVHSFWVPQLNRKIDAIPGRTNELTFEAEDAGTYRGQCAEFCGIQHANMGFLVIAEDEGDFETWLSEQAKPAEPSADDSARAGEAVFMGAGCASCHAVRGTEADGEVGPDLTHLAARETIAGALLSNERGELGGWVLDPQHIKPGVKMPGTELTGRELQDLLDYLQGLE